MAAPLTRPCMAELVIEHLTDENAPLHELATRAEADAHPYRLFSFETLRAPASPTVSELHRRRGKNLVAAHSGASR